MAGSDTASNSSDPNDSKRPLIKRNATSRISTRPRRESFPSKQLFFLALVRISEPIAFTSIFAYVYFMVASFDIAKNESDIAIYASLILCAFTFAEFTTGIFWGKVSDRYGRKPVLIIGLIGTLISMLMFGFAKSYPMALLARAIGGALNGNQGVLQTTVAELVEGRPEWQSKAFAIMPFVFCLGAMIGPALGGLLAEPVGRYPGWFSTDGIFAEYPYLLPNLVTTGVLVMGISVGWLFLEETHQELGTKPDTGIQVGRWIMTSIQRAFGMEYKLVHQVEESESLLGTTATPTPTHHHYGTTAQTIHPAEDLLPLPVAIIDEPESSSGPPPKAFTRSTVHLIISYGLLALHTICHEQLLPVFLSTPLPTEPPTSFFRFAGGFGYSASQVGVVLSIQGLMSLFANFLYHPMVSMFGVERVYKYTLYTYPIVYLTFPYLLFLPTSGLWRQLGVYAFIVVKIMYAVLAYPSNAILLTNKTESAAVLGTVNGAAASTASIARAVGPFLAGLAYSAGLRMGISGLVWWAVGGVCALGGLQVGVVGREVFGEDREEEDRDGSEEH